MTAPVIWPTPPGLEAKYQVWLLNHDGGNVELLENYEELEYVVAAVGNGAAVWGSYRISGVATKMHTDDFLLDYVVSVRRQAPGGAWRADFEGLHRRIERWFDEKDREMFRSAGTDLRSLVRRRIMFPVVGQAFLTVSDEFTDVMRELVRTQAALKALTERQMYHLVVENDTNQGASVTYSTRDSQLSSDLELLSGLGATFDIVRIGSSYVFKVYYPRSGADRRQDNIEGNDPVVFSIANGNTSDPAFTDDRLNETNVAYVAGEGAGARRPMVKRYDLWNARFDSPWNRIEAFIDGSQQTGTAALLALGDAFLMENRRALSFACRAIPTQLCLYGRDWFVGDLVTGIYNDVAYDLSVDAATITLNSEVGEQIIPTFRWIP